MGEIRVALVGVGNCASNFVQGIEYYRAHPDDSTGLMHRVIGGYDVADIKIVCAFDIDARKVGRDLSEAIFAPPNCTEPVARVPHHGVTVQMGPVLDGWGEHLAPLVQVADASPVDVERVLDETRPDVMVILLPTASRDAAYFYARAALRRGIGIVNGIPVLLSHDPEIVALATAHGAALVGDDFKSQIGGTALHHALMHLLDIRGVKITKSYQLNFAGNTDFLNLVARGQEKHKSKARGVLAGVRQEVDLSVNVSYVENMHDVKTCFVWIEGRNFAGCPVTLEAKLTVVDSANSSGVLVDAIRCVKVAKDRGITGVLEAPSAFFMKSPPKQIPDDEAVAQIEAFIGNK